MEEKGPHLRARGSATSIRIEIACKFPQRGYLASLFDRTTFVHSDGLVSVVKERPNYKAIRPQVSLARVDFDEVFHAGWYAVAKVIVFGNRGSQQELQVALQRFWHGDRGRSMSLMSWKAGDRSLCKGLRLRRT